MLHDAALAAIAERRPSDWADLAGTPGIGPAKLDRYADEVLAVVAVNRRLAFSGSAAALLEGL